MLAVAWAADRCVDRHHQRPVAGGLGAPHEIARELAVRLHVKLKPKRRGRLACDLFERHARLRAHDHAGAGCSGRQRRRMLSVGMRKLLIGDGSEEDRRVEALPEQRQPRMAAGKVAQNARAQRDAPEGRAILAQRQFIGRAAINVGPRLLRHALAHTRNVDADDLLTTLEAMATVSRRAEVQRPASRASAERRWRKLGAELRTFMKRRVPPSTPRVLALARRARIYLDEFAGGDRATLDALARLRRAAPPKELAGWTPALMKYLDQALTALT